MGTALHGFFSQQQAVARTADDNSTSPFYALVSGPPRSGKTSLLFQFAYNCALQDSSSVVFICKRSNMERKPPVLSQDVDAASEVFERVHMKYAEDDDDLRRYFAAFHLHNDVPKAVVIDDFCEFFDEWKCRRLYGQQRGREVAIVKTLALCRDAMDHANRTSPPGVECKFVVSDTHVGQGPRLLYIYQRWLPIILTIEGLGSKFTLKAHQTDRGQGVGAYANYSLAQERLTLEALI